jgi:uncharacterized protein (TIGR03435 family)
MTLAGAVSVFAVCLSGVIFAQSSPEFDVASIKPADHDGLIENHTPSLNVEPGRNLTFANISVRDVMMLAYGVGAPQISGPEWLLTRYDIVAKVPADASKTQIPLMLQTLLAQRFKLAFHRDQKVIQIFALEIAKGGPKMQESLPEGKQAPGCNRSFAERPDATLAAVCQRMTSADIAQQVQTLAPGYFRDGPVIDMTGLKGTYDFKLEWITRGEATAGSDGPSMFDAVQQQLGLKLESRKQSLEIFVIDHCEKTPTEN